LLTVYVDTNAPGPEHDGNSWATAYVDLQQALHTTDEIRVADGTYKPTTKLDRRATFQLSYYSRISGGFAGYGAADPDFRDPTHTPTILSGDIGVVGDSSDNSYHVLDIDASYYTAVFDGFTVSDGNADGSGGGNSADGGGIYNSESAVGTISNCTFINNSAVSGGGIYNYRSQFTLIHCKFIGNVATGSGFGGGGGGLYNLGGGNEATFVDCTFESNRAIGSDGGGGGIRNDSGDPIITGCTFNANSGFYGGGLFNLSSASPALDNCTFEANSATYGAGIYSSYFSSPTLFNCGFHANSALNAGGAMFNVVSYPKVTACVFRANSAGTGGAMYNLNGYPNVLSSAFVGNVADSGGAIYNSASEPKFTCCTFAGNSANVSGGAIYNGSYVATFKNCILWANSAPDGSQIFVRLFEGRPLPPSVSDSDVQGGFAGSGNIDGDPKFARDPSPGADSAWGTADDDYGDLRLQDSSPCIDVGNNAALTGDATSDLAGKPRFSDFPTVHDPGAIVDLGAFETLGIWGVVNSSYLFDAPKPSVRFTFSAPVSLTSLSVSDLTLTNLTSGRDVDCAALATLVYDANTRSATWTFSTALLPDGNYRAVVPPGAISDSTNTPLASDNHLDFFVLGGDANRDRLVDINDLSVLASNWSGSSKFFSQADFNYDGKVDAVDLGILAGSWQKSLPPPPGPGILHSLPRRSPTRILTLV
jgi:hypothetical protein